MSYTEMNQKEINSYFIQACEKCDLPLISYFLKSRDLKKKADVTAKNNEGLKLACINGKADNQL